MSNQPSQGTGACGLNCLVCGLMREGKCSPCGAGTEAQAQAKLAAQLRLIGSVCPILQCAVAKKIDYCSASCEVYPCRHFMSGPYPLSSAYLEMQVRRRGQNKPAAPPAAQPRGGGDKGTLH